MNFSRNGVVSIVSIVWDNVATSYSINLCPRNLMTKSRRQRSRIATRKKYSFELVTELLQCRWSRHQLRQQSSVVWITGNTSGYAEYSIILAANHLQQSYGINDVMLHKKVSEAHAISPRCHHRPLAWPVQQRSGHQHYCAAGPVTPVPDKYAFQVTD